MSFDKYLFKIVKKINLIDKSLIIYLIYLFIRIT
jgi:hypothetical protein